VGRVVLAYELVQAAGPVQAVAVLLDVHDGTGPEPRRRRARGRKSAGAFPGDSTRCASPAGNR
jgi:hypothetical protein